MAIIITECEGCEGTGQDPDNEKQDCKYCDGTGLEKPLPKAKPPAPQPLQVNPKSHNYIDEPPLMNKEL